MEVLEVISQGWAIRAIITSSMVGIMCGVIGSFIVLRNMSLIGDALAHAILPGVFVAFLLFGKNNLGFFLGSVVAGILTVMMISWIQQNIKTKNDAAIGIVFTAMFSLGVIGISWLNNAQGAHLDLKDFLFGNVMGISNTDIILNFIVLAYTLFCVIVFYRYFFITTFQPIIAQTMGISVKYVHYFLMLLLSFAVVSALSAVGVILVVAMLITPSSSALLLSNKLKNVIIISALLGLLSTTSGFLLSVVFSFPPGPAMVVMATAIYAVIALIAPEKGLIVRMRRSMMQKVKIQQEDILRQAIKYIGKGGISKEKLIEELSLGKATLNKRLTELKRQGVLTNGDTVNLTAKGKLEAESLVRAHRLWESYQVQKMGLSEGQIHKEADRLEHYLTEEILDEVDLKLGYPTTDPHGSPIPQKNRLNKQTLLGQKLNQRLKISKHQTDESVESDLWELGILPESQVVIDSINNSHVLIRHKGKRLEIPVDLANKILIQRRNTANRS